METVTVDSHGHVQVPADAADGDKLACSCGVTYEFVLLDDGLPGEWVQTSNN